MDAAPLPASLVSYARRLVSTFTSTLPSPSSPTSPSYSTSSTSRELPREEASSSSSGPLGTTRPSPHQSAHDIDAHSGSDSDHIEEKSDSLLLALLAASAPEVQAALCSELGLAGTWLHALDVFLSQAELSLARVDRVSEGDGGGGGGGGGEDAAGVLLSRMSSTLALQSVETLSSVTLLFHQRDLVREVTEAHPDLAPVVLTVLHRLLLGLPSSIPVYEASSPTPVTAHAGMLYDQGKHPLVSESEQEDGLDESEQRLQLLLTGVSLCTQLLHRMTHVARTPELLDALFGVNAALGFDTLDRLWELALHLQQRAALATEWPQRDLLLSAADTVTSQSCDLLDVLLSSMSDAQPDLAARPAPCAYPFTALLLLSNRVLLPLDVVAEMPSTTSLLRSIALLLVDHPSNCAVFCAPETGVLMPIIALAVSSAVEATHVALPGSAVETLHYNAMGVLAAAAGCASGGDEDDDDDNDSDDTAAACKSLVLEALGALSSSELGQEHPVTAEYLQRCVDAHALFVASVNSIRSNPWSERVIQDALHAISDTLGSFPAAQHLAAQLRTHALHLSRTLLACLSNIDEAIMKQALAACYNLVLECPAAQTEVLLADDGLWPLADCIYDYNVSIKLQALETLCVIASGLSHGGARSFFSFVLDMRRCNVFAHLLMAIKSFPAEDVPVQIVDAATSLFSHALTPLHMDGDPHRFNQDHCLQAGFMSVLLRAADQLVAHVPLSAPSLSALHSVLVALGNLLYHNSACQDKFSQLNGLAACEAILNWLQDSADVGGEAEVVAALTVVINAVDAHQENQHAFASVFWQGTLHGLIVAALGDDVQRNDAATERQVLRARELGMRLSPVAQLRVAGMACLIISHVTWRNLHNQDLYGHPQLLSQLVQLVALGSSELERASPAPLLDMPGDVAATSDPGFALGSDEAAEFAFGNPADTVHVRPNPIADKLDREEQSWRRQQDEQLAEICDAPDRITVNSLLPRPSMVRSGSAPVTQNSGSGGSGHGTPIDALTPAALGDAGEFEMAQRQLGFYASVALVNLTFRQPHNKDIVGQHGGVAKLLPMLDSPMLEVRSTAAVCIGNLVKDHDENARQLVDAGGVEQLMQWINDDDDDDLSKKAFLTLVHAHSRAVSQLVLHVDALLNRMGVVEDEELLDAADLGELARTLAVLNGLIYLDETNRELAVAKFGIAPVLRVFEWALQMPMSLRVVQLCDYASYLLNNLTSERTDETQLAFARAGIFSVLERYLHSLHQSGLAAEVDASPLYSALGNTVLEQPECIRAFLSHSALVQAVLAECSSASSAHDASVDAIELFLHVFERYPGELPGIPDGLAVLTHLAHSHVSQVLTGRAKQLRKELQ